MKCDCCGDKTKNITDLEWIVCNKCLSKMYLCDACGKSLDEVDTLMKDECDNLVCVDCYEKLKEE